MYSEQFKESLALVEASREKNIALEPVRMTAEEKDKVLASFHPDYKVDEFEVLKIGPNKGDKVPKELAAILQAHSRIPDSFAAATIGEKRKMYGMRKDLPEFMVIDRENHVVLNAVSMENGEQEGVASHFSKHSRIC